ncbi:MAG: class I SAM-dependent rRNA methyltransferase [Chloroflexaceae bacterium]|nr:class I SAM-dependent rRNA methyltransferase [Chloroflexaceae bacterium]
MQDAAPTRRSESEPACIHLRLPSPWADYELIDTGDGQKLERFGRYQLIRPETQAIWSPALPSSAWEQADALFQRSRGEDGPGTWVQRRQVPEQWSLQHDGLAFWVRLTPFRHTGVFPEHSAHWPWMRKQLARATRTPSVLVLFGYTGLQTLVAAQMGAQVCHVDASRPATRWAQANQKQAGLEHCSIRWIVDDVGKFVQREIRRGSRYDMILLDPPVFGRGPKGEIWRLHESLQWLMHTCVSLLSEQPLGLLMHTYATNLSSLTLHNVLATTMQPYGGTITAGELVLTDTAARRPLSQAAYGCWSRD